MTESIRICSVGNFKDEHFEQLKKDTNCPSLKVWFGLFSDILSVSLEDISQAQLIYDTLIEYDYLEPQIIYEKIVPHKYVYPCIN